MIALRRRSVMARSGIVAAVVGVLAITSLSGATVAPRSATATARASAPVVSSSPASVSEGHTKCVPWPKPTSLGEKCTGTYSGNKAWNPWTWRSISQQPVVTVSQTRDLSDEGVQINWSDFTPSLDNFLYSPNPSTINPLYQVSIFECEGTNPNAKAFGLTSTRCYMSPVGSSLNQTTGPPNGLLENTLDASSPPKTKRYACSSYAFDNQFPSTSVGCNFMAGPGIAPIPIKPKWDGGSPATWIGQADFHVEAPTPRSEGGFFNCGLRTPCSLVIVPNWGGTPGACDEHSLGDGNDPTVAEYKQYNRDLLGHPSQNPNSITTGDFSTGGSAGGSDPTYAQSTSIATPASLEGASTACWAADRIVIPLSFAPTPSDCASKTPAFYAQGSPMMQTQMLDWQAGWCNGAAPVTLAFTSNSESTAREDFLAGNQFGGAETDMALVTLPITAAERQASSRKFTYAPLANSGVDIAFVIDDQNTGSQINRMVLDPRLVAKLTTQSYTLEYTNGCTGKNSKPSLINEGCDPAVYGNPYSLFDDPEFLSLNRQCQPYGKPANYTCRNLQNTTGTDDFPPDTDAGGGTTYGDFLPTVLESDSDMTYDLTDWIASNLDAREFLDGKRDPWRMHVNNNYLRVPYPAQAFPVLDNGYTLKVSCGGVSSKDPCTSLINTQDVTMQASWNPQIDLATIVADILANQPTSSLPDFACGAPCNAFTDGTLTTPSSPQPPGIVDLLSELDLGDIAGYQLPAAELVNAAGKAVGPTQASIEAAVSDMKTNPDGITQYSDFATKDPAAYPLAMVDYAMVPTCGLSSAKASAVADFLTKVATTGQTQGEAPGDLAPGYYPLNAKQKAQTLKAAQEVKAQTCGRPAQHTHTTTDHTTTHKQTPGGSSPSASPKPRKTPARGHQSPSSSPTGRGETTAFGEKSADSGMTGVLLLLAIIVGVLLMLGGPTAWVITVTGRWPVVFRWVRAVRARLRTGLGRLAGRMVRRA
jgi:hypothetical protein